MSDSTGDKLADCGELAKPRQPETGAQRQTLAQMWSEGDPCAVVGMVKQYSHIENNMGAPKASQTEPQHGPTNTLLGC